MDYTLDGREAVVTGAGRNVGAAIAERFARSGARVAVLDLDEDRVHQTEATVDGIRKGAGRAWVCDVADAASVARVAQEVDEAFRRLDILANNVALSDRGHTVLDLPDQGWDRVVVAYSASKAGVLNITRSIDAQLAPFGLRAVGVSPNRVGSPVGEDEAPADRNQQNLVGRAGQPEDIANAVQFLVSDEASFITAVDLLVDGGSHYGGTSA